MDNSNINTIFGQRLKELRENKGLYQEDVGEWFKMKKSTVSQWESGRLPHATIIAGLSQKFNATTDYLLGRADNPGVALIPPKHDISAEDLELLRKIKDLPADKREIVDVVIKVSEASKDETTAVGK